MTRTIEQELVIPADGRLPETFRQCFGRKARIVVSFAEDEKEGAASPTRRYRVLTVAERIIPDRDSIHER